MKKWGKITLIIFIILVAAYLCLCAAVLVVTEQQRTAHLELDGESIVITEEYFIDYLNEISAHGDRYIGRQIVIQGIYGSEEIAGQTDHLVGIEYTCDSHEEDCSDHHFVGIQFLYEEDALLKDGAEIQVTGELSLKERDGAPYLVLADCTVYPIS